MEEINKDMVAFIKNEALGMKNIVLPLGTTAIAEMESTIWFLHL
jgi:hypothetical protein